MARQGIPSAADEHLNVDAVLPVLKDRTVRLVRSTGKFTVGIGKIYRALVPLVELINRREDVREEELTQVLDGLFEALQAHPLNNQFRDLTSRMRSENLLPNEASTEQLIRFLVDQVTARSVVPIPPEVTAEFWKFFNQLMGEPELKGLGEVSLDVLRIVVNAYEPLIVQIMNQLKELRRASDAGMRDILANTRVIRDDLVIFRRQIGALRHIRTFFATDPMDFSAQAEVVAGMVREFGPFFIKMAQVAAASSDFLPDEIARELAVFQEDVAPMTAAEVEQAFLECYGELPEKRYYGFDAERPIKSGSIASVYLAQKPLGEHRGKQLLVPVVVKVGRQNLEREFLIGKTVIKLAILSSQYWAPHSKLSPFLSSWLEQVDVFVEGFRRELDFEAEAENQMRFARRAAVTDGWHVPRVYHRSRRIIEMEFVDSAAGLNAAFLNRSGRKSRRARRRAGRTFLHAVISHLLVYREFHGDLHPGNVLLDADMRLFFIDWGNTVDVSSIWRPALRYVYAVATGDAAAVARAVMELGVAPGTRPAEDPAALAELEQIVEETLAQSGLKRLGYDFALTLAREGHQGLLQRLELAINLAVALSRQGVVVRSDYLHLTRSLMAMLGSFLGLYAGLPRTALAQDVAQVLVQFPALESLRQAAGYRRQLLRRVSRRGGQSATLPECTTPAHQATTQVH